MKNVRGLLVYALFLTLLLTACGGETSPSTTPFTPGTIMSTAVDVPADSVVLSTPESLTPALQPETEPEQTPTPRPLPTRATGYSVLPTPDPPHNEVESDGENVLLANHTIRPGETLGFLSNYYQVDLPFLLEINGLTADTVLQVGQVLLIPSEVEASSPAFKIIPDSELVYGPAVAGFDVRQFSEAYGGYLLQYRDQVEGRTLAGPEIVELVALRFSVNPRLLLAALEFRTGWVSRANPPTRSEFMMGLARPGYEGLYQQLSWAANQMNMGYYGRREGGLNAFTLGNGTRVGFAPTINHGTAGVQKWLGAHDTANLETWLVETQASGFYGTYDRLFGSPFAFTFEPLLPPDLAQPRYVLPWQTGEIWYFTGGPHGGWASGSAWAALDFAPDKEQLGCYLSPSWVTAVDEGVVVFSDMGGVLVDKDGDGNPGTGWVAVYWHVDRSERVPVGTQLQAGDKIGHPSCEGGFSNGTHLHLARRYNGHWISADGEIPFVMDEWIALSAGREYDGYMVRGDTVREACVCVVDEVNGILRE